MKCDEKINKPVITIVIPSSVLWAWRMDVASPGLMAAVEAAIFLPPIPLQLLDAWPSYKDEVV